MLSTDDFTEVAAMVRINNVRFTAFSRVQGSIASTKFGKYR